MALSNVLSDLDFADYTCLLVHCRTVIPGADLRGVDWVASHPPSEKPIIKI